MQVLWALGDHQGSLRDYATYDAGEDETTVAEHFVLDSFGNILAGDTSGIRYIYTAQEFDAETGFYYYDTRYVDPGTGRFISEDWIRFAGDPSNVFRYVVNAPTMYTDPNGLYAWWPITHWWPWGPASEGGVGEWADDMKPHVGDAVLEVVEIPVPVGTAVEAMEAGEGATMIALKVRAYRKWQGLLQDPKAKDKQIQKAYEEYVEAVDKCKKLEHEK